MNISSQEYRSLTNAKLTLLIVILVTISMLTACGGGGTAQTSNDSIQDNTGSPVTGASEAWLDISDLSQSTYVWDTFENGKLRFIDRQSVFGSSVDSQVPDRYAGNIYLRTAKDDRISTGENHVSFTINNPVTVFVAHDNGITNKPAWLNSWIDTGDDFLSRSIYRKDFAAGSISLGGNTTDGVVNGSMYMVFLKPRDKAEGTRVITQDTNGSLQTTILTNTQITDISSDVIVATPDIVTTNSDTAINIPVLVNDSGISSTTTISIEGTPSNGNTTILANNTITYTPNTSYTGTDSFSYKVADNNTAAIATVTIDVKCTQCTQDKTIGLSWSPSVSGSNVGYLIYYGSDIDNIDKFAFDLSADTGLNPVSPNISFSAKNDLQLNSGDTVCFRISAYVSSLESDLSEAICGVI